MDYHSTNNTDIAPTIMSWGLKYNKAQKCSYMCKCVQGKEKYILQEVSSKSTYSITRVTCLMLGQALFPSTCRREKYVVVAVAVAFVISAVPPPPLLARPNPGHHVHVTSAKFSGSLTPPASIKFKQPPFLLIFYWVPPPFSLQTSYVHAPCWTAAGYGIGCDTPCESGRDIPTPVRKK